jgi:hypothetical protein
VPRPIVVKIRSEGVEQVKNAFKTIAQAGEEMERRMARTGAEGSSVRVKSARAELAEKEKTFKAAERAAERAMREAQRAAAAEAKGTEAAEKAKQRAVDASAKYMDRVRENSALMAGRWAKHEADAQIREAKRVSEHQEKMARAGMGRVASSVRGTVSTMTNVGRQVTQGVLQVGGGFSIADSVQSAQAANKQAAILANNSYLPGQKMDAKFASASDPERADPAKLLAHARAISLTSGISSEELLGASTKYVKRTGEVGGAMGNLEFFAKMAKATGGDVGDIADTAGKLRKQNTDLDEKGVRAMMMNMVQAGKLGSVTMDEMASVAPKITKTRSYYQGDQTHNQQTLLGLAQIASRSGGGASEAGTTVSNLAQDALKHSANINAMGGKKITDANGKLLAPEELIAEVFRKSHGDMGKIQGMGFGARSVKLFGELQSSFEKAGGYKDVEAGVRGVRAEMAPLTGATYDEDKLDADVKVVQASEQFEHALNELKEAVGAELLPELTKLVPVLKDATPSFIKLLRGATDVADFLIAHPFAGIGAIIAGKLVLDIGAAMIGEKLKEKLLSIVSNIGGAPGGGGGGGGGVGAGSGAAAPIAMAGAGAIVSFKAGVDSGLAGQRAGQFEGGALEWDLKNGTPEAKKAAADKINAAKERSGGIKGMIRVVANAQGLGFSTANSWITGEKNFAAEEIGRTMKEREIGGLKVPAGDPRGQAPEVRQSIQDLVKALQENTAATRNGGGGGGGGGGHPQPHRHYPISHTERGGAK